MFMFGMVVCIMKNIFIIFAIVTLTKMRLNTFIFRLGIKVPNPTQKCRRASKNGHLGLFSRWHIPVHVSSDKTTQAFPNNTYHLAFPYCEKSYYTQGSCSLTCSKTLSTFFPFRKAVPTKNNIWFSIIIVEHVRIVRLIYCLFCYLYFISKRPLS